MNELYVKVLQARSIDLLNSVQSVSAFITNLNICIESIDFNLIQTLPKLSDKEIIHTPFTELAKVDTLIQHCANSSLQLSRSIDIAQHLLCNLNTLKDALMRCHIPDPS